MNQNKDKINLLIVCSQAEHFNSINLLLQSVKQFSISVVHAKTYTDALVKLAKDDFNICFADDIIDDQDSLVFLSSLKKRSLVCPIIILSSSPDEERNLAALRNGACDYLFKKNLKSIFLERAIKYALERHQSRTEIVQLEKNLLSSQKMKAMVDMATSISGSLGGIFRYMKSSLEQIQKKPEEIKEKTISDLLCECSRGEALITQLALSSHNQASMLPGINLQEIVFDTVELIARSLNKNISVSTSVYRKSKLLIKGNPVQLRQAIINILINAQEAMPKGGSIHINFSTELENYVKLNISDSGHGIEKSDLSRIFEPFYSQKKGQNIGLGLSTVYSIVNSHGGKIEVDSQLGKGSTFSLIFPLENQSKSSKAIFKKFTRGLIMIIDNDPTNLQLAKLYLESANFTTKTFDDTNEAIAWYSSRSEEVGIILLNPSMPRIGGVACFQTLKKVNPIARIALCSDNNGALENTLIKDGALKHFAKPTNYPMMVSWIAETLGNL